MVTELKVGEKELPFLYSWEVVKQLKRLGINDELDAVDVTAYLSFKQGCEAKGIAVDFKEKDVRIWLNSDFYLVGQVTELIKEGMGRFEAGGKSIAPKAKK